MKMLSIIIPVYNAADYLKQCLDSILQQDFPDFEVILINDGSLDSSPEICDAYAKADSRVKVFHKKNEGVSIARNVGLDHVSGEWILFVDSDDFFLPNAFEKIIAIIKNSDIDVLLANSKVLVGSEMRELTQFKFKESSNVLANVKHSALWAYVFKTSVIQDNHIRFVPGLAFSEDRVFIYHVALFCKKIQYIDEYIYVYRRYENSVCGSSNGLKKANHQFAAAKSLLDLVVLCGNDSYKKRIVELEVKNVLNMGCRSFVSHSSVFRDYRTYEALYLKFFTNKKTLFFLTIKNWFIHMRRKLITFRKDPLKMTTTNSKGGK